MRQYLELLDTVMREGEDRTDRTGVGTRSLFGWQSRYDLAEGFPLVSKVRPDFSLSRTAPSRARRRR